MTSFTSDDEILEFAIAREVEANQLYRYMANRITNPEICLVCEDLAKEELEHKAKLELEVMKRGRVVSNINTPDYMMDVGDEMDMGYDELIVFAIKKEQISIDLYNNLAEIAKDKDSRQLLLSLVQEETEHKKRFEIEYNNLSQEN